ncbi:stage III sporulation protein AF [Paenibacillus sp. sptzw28]|uniref:stage III sporulation protein AF n=1 Tax=Paenibacillus sp. sptzw28 TaxID=715179 RepID=UPI001C6F34F6|nr:stage III sporulation protein AF [Paenibacillus sp. sptzw28]QYR20007.1 stage III sporulation protein AF [Paenibacillus sp. sptzw28]
MLTWLAVWLQQIIAVVLLAGFIDLLLPNKSMQRYVRLIAGLIILLTIMSPIIRLLQGDFSTRLDQNMENWFKAGAAKEIRMPTLQDIQQDAEALRRKQQAAAAALTERQLANAMREQIIKRTGLQVEELTLTLEPAGSKGGQDAAIKSVMVTLSASGDPDAGQPPAGNGNQPEAAENPGSKAGAEQKNDSKDMMPVEQVMPVNIMVQPDTGETDSVDVSGDRGYVPVGGHEADVITQVLRDGWAVAPQAIAVRQISNNGGSGR